MERIFLSDGTVLHGGYDAVGFLNSIGISYESDFRALFYMLREIVGEDDELSLARDKADEYEMVADGYCQNLVGLCDEVRAVAEKLISGKRGANYTKEYLGNALLNAVRTYEI